MDIKNVTCYGAGLIGSSWATSYLLAGNLNVTIYDLNQEQLDHSKQAIERELAFLVSEGILTEEEAKEKVASVKFTTDVAEAVKDADFIQENGPERIELKQQIVETIEEYCSEKTIIASSTSGLLISDIAAKAKHPERFIGGHPYNPVYLIPLVEMTKGEHTTDEVLEAGLAFYKSLNKEPVVLQQEVPGFISNRLQAAVFREAAELVNRGVCTVDEVDRALCYGPGLRMALMGMHTTYQLTGGPYGINGALRHIGVTATEWFKDMASWCEFPGIYANPDIIQEKTNEALALRKEDQGRDSAGLMKFRDKGLVTLLKYHGKL